jgi:hypothetical protein
MSAGSWLSTILARVRRSVIQDVPANLEACESCREADCARERWLACAKRLAGEAERLAEHGIVLSATAESGEMPGVSSPAIPAAAEGGEQREQDAHSVKSGSSN